MIVKERFKIYDFIKEKYSEFDDFVLLGFGKIDRQRIHEEKILIECIFAPVKGRIRDLDNAFSDDFNITNLAFLNSRLRFKKNSAPEHRKPASFFTIQLTEKNTDTPPLVSLSNLPTNDSWITQKFKTKYSTFLNSKFCKLDAINTETNQNVSAYISCAELLRFYYPHNRLIEAVLSGEDAEIRLFNPSVPLSKNSRPFIQLRKQIPDICAPHVARYRFSKKAMSCYDKVFKYTMHGVPGTPEKDSYLRVYPPVELPCIWTVGGRTIDEKQGILIEQLIQCDANVPFGEVFFTGQEIDFNRDNDGRTTHDRPKPKRVISIPALKAVSPELNNIDTPLSIALDMDAQIQLETLNIHINDAEQSPKFGFLKNLSVKKIEKVSLVDPDSMRVKVYIGEALIDAISLSGAMHHDNRDNIARAEISTGSIHVDNNPENESNLSYYDAFHFFQSVISKFTAQFEVTWRNVSIISRQIKKRSMYLNAFEYQFIEESGLDWLYFDKRAFRESETMDDKFNLVRKFVVAELSQEDRYYYFVDFESQNHSFDERVSKSNSCKPSSILFFCSAHLAEMDRRSILQEIKDYVIDKSNWSRNARHYYRDTAKHVDNLFKNLELKIQEANYHFGV